MVLYIENLQKKNPEKANKQFAGYEINTQVSVVFLYICNKLSGKNK